MDAERGTGGTMPDGVRCRPGSGPLISSTCLFLFGAGVTVGREQRRWADEHFVVPLNTPTCLVSTPRRRHMSQTVNSLVAVLFCAN